MNIILADETLKPTASDLYDGNLVSVTREHGIRAAVGTVLECGTAQPNT